MIKTISTSQKGWKDKISRIIDRSRLVPPDIDLKVRKIIDKVKAQGDKALFDYTLVFDGFDPKDRSIVIEAEEISSALSKIDPQLITALKEAAYRIDAFHQHEIQDSWITTDSEGVILGQKISPIDRVGVYIPGGKNAFPSTMLMNVIPARIAGVKDIVVTTPTPKGEINPVLLAAAHIVGVEKIYRIGGAQAIAALAYGTESIPKVDKIVGPGNIYVSHAKRLLYSTVGIDLVAGPSEILIIADKGAKTHIVAMDLLSQAEHDPMASAILLTPDKSLADDVLKQISIEVSSMPREKIIKQSLMNHGVCVITKDIDEAIKISNRVAPEHLELMIENAYEYLDEIENAGAIFLGYHTSEVLGDYIAGPNHTLPTGRASRFYSSLGVYDFLKRSSIIGFSEQALEKLGPMAARIARSEELEAHARSVEYRLKG